MIRIEYFKDYRSDRWLPYTGINADSTVLLSSPTTAWCDIHNRWERITRGEVAEVFFACGGRVFAPSCYEGEQRLTSVLFSVDKNKLSLDVSLRYFTPRLCKGRKIISKKSTVSHFDLHSGQTVVEHLTMNNLSYSEDVDLEAVPEELQPQIQHVLSMLSKGIFAIECKNTYLPCQNGFKHFVKFPSCPAISQLKPCFGALADRRSLRAFDGLCANFGIKAMKNFRRMFTDNPNVFLVNVFLQSVGFTDPNVFNHYYNNAAIMMLLAEHLSCRKGRMGQVTVSFKGRSINLRNMAFWREKALEKVGEMTAARRLIEPIIKGDTPLDIMVDALAMYREYYDDIPTPLKDRILKEAFTTATHDRLVEALADVRGRDRYGRFSGKRVSDDTPISYTDEELALECKIGDLNFALPKKIADLHVISDRMHNCVGYLYPESVLSKECDIIVVIEKEADKMVACIEKHDKNIVQALGPCNARIKEQYIPPIRQWIKMHRLKTSCTDLAEERVLRAGRW